MEMCWRYLCLSLTHTHMYVSTVLPDDIPALPHGNMTLCKYVGAVSLSHTHTHTHVCLLHLPDDVSTPGGNVEIYVCVSRCVALCCGVMWYIPPLSDGNLKIHTATHWCVAVCCSVLQCGICEYMIP